MGPQRCQKRPTSVKRDLLLSFTHTGKGGHGTPEGGHIGGKCHACVKALGVGRLCVCERERVCVCVCERVCASKPLACVFVCV
jgi:hypothetical protein